MGVKVDVSELRAFSQKLKTLEESQVETFMERASRESANWLLALVIPRTPSDRGILRRGWVNNTEGQARKGGDVSAAEQAAHAARLPVQRGKRGGYSVTLINPVKYASYVEHGHRQRPGRFVPVIGKRLKKKWVEGKHFLRKAEEDLRQSAPTLLEELLDDFLRQVF